jgi:hypothetical protein
MPGAGAAAGTAGFWHSPAVAVGAARWRTPGPARTREPPVPLILASGGTTIPMSPPDRPVDAMKDAVFLLLATALVAVPVAVVVVVRRRFPGRVSAFEWIVLACCYAGFLLTVPALEDAAAGRRPWTDALLAAAALTLMPVAYALAVSLHALPIVLVEVLWSRRRRKRVPRDG